MLSELDKNIAQNPCDCLSYARKASLLIQMDQPKEALQVCDQALKLHEKHEAQDDQIARVYAKKGVCFSALGDFDKAVACFKRAVKLYGNPQINDRELEFQELLRSDCDGCYIDT